MGENRLEQLICAFNNSTIKAQELNELISLLLTDRKKILALSATSRDVRLAGGRILRRHFSGPNQ